MPRSRKPDRDAEHANRPDREARLAAVEAGLAAYEGIGIDSTARKARAAIVPMRVVQTMAQVDDDGMLHVRMPHDAPRGEVEVIASVTTTVDRPTKRQRVGRSARRRVAELIATMSNQSKGAMSEEERRAAADAGFGALRALPRTVDEFLAERRLEESWREMRLMRGTL